MHVFKLSEVSSNPHIIRNDVFANYYHVHKHLNNKFACIYGNKEVNNNLLLDKAIQNEKRLERNERARRRTALKAVLKPLPKEIELLIYDYMRPTTKGPIEVAMRWQIHPIVRIVEDIFNKRLTVSQIL